MEECETPFSSALSTGRHQKRKQASAEGFYSHRQGKDFSLYVVFCLFPPFFFLGKRKLLMKPRLSTLKEDGEKSTKLEREAKTGIRLGCVVKLCIVRVNAREKASETSQREFLHPQHYFSLSPQYFSFLFPSQILSRKTHREEKSFLS